MNRSNLNSLKISQLLLIVLGSIAFAAPKPNDAPNISDVNRVTSISIDQIKVRASRIDTLVEEQLAQKKIRPNEDIDDEVFVRRIYLDIVGRIPTYQETTDFLSTDNKERRSILIDKLLDSPGYDSHFFNYWADVLRVKTSFDRGIPGQPYVDFVKESVRSNKAYDKFVREMIAADGAFMERGNGAVGYFIRDFQMPEDSMANTVRLFLGTRLECAQCHDHPFDKWTQREFFEMVAFTGGLQMQLRQPFISTEKILSKFKSAKIVSPRAYRNAQGQIRLVSYSIAGNGTGVAQLPDTYQADDGVPNELVFASTMFGREPLVKPEVPKHIGRNRKRNSLTIYGAKDVGSRASFADWLTNTENKRFAQVIANRLWKKAMGLGVIEPVDDMTDNSKAFNPSLMANLTSQMIELKFDMKQFLRVVFNTKTYQRAATSREPDSREPYYFVGPILRRMSAEQIWDSLLGFAVADVDNRIIPTKKYAPKIFGAEDLYDAYEKLMNVRPGKLVELAKGKGQLNVSGSKKPGLKSEQMTMENEMAGYNPAFEQPDLVRASELPSPARIGHFLREFGQSDRDQIEASSSDFAVTQALSLMNGFVEKNIVTNPRTILVQDVNNTKSLREKTELIFLTILNRHPSKPEQQLWLNSGQGNDVEVAQDLIWALCNSTEFLFIK